MNYQKKDKIKLIVSDIDGTLLNSENKFEPLTETAVRGFIRENQCGFTICTGRPFPLVKPLADYLGMKMPFIYSSNSIYDPRTKKFISTHSFKQEYIEEIARISGEFDAGILIHTKEQLICRVNDDDWQTVQSFEWLKGKKIDHAVRIEKITPIKPEDILRIDIFFEGDRLSAIFQEVIKTIPDVYAVEMKRSIEITPNRLHKGYALNNLSRLLKIPLKHIMAVGDSLNDFPLLMEAGYGVAMATAPDALKKIADAIIPSVDENGLVRAFEIAQAVF
jgi:Cof subfamily protein (haloacid dehalogenase superfamily)